MKNTAKFVGVDFGTSNSAAAMAGASRRAPAQVISLDPGGDDDKLLRSVLFFPDGCADVLVGSEAIARYVANEDGRFIQSIKSFLPSPGFTRTVIRRRSWALPELVAAILKTIRERIEKEIGEPMTQVVFGRPATFSTDPAVDALAQERLAEAALLAGFPKPTFLIEPIAAALRYEESLDRDELVLVGDFGAGTSDFTLMRLGESRAGEMDRRKDIVASTGVYVGGDNFDAAIVEHALLSRFGHGSTYTEFTSRTELPAWIVRKMLRWHELSVLREPRLMDLLRRAEASSSDPEGMRNLLSLLEENLAYDLFRAVESCKRDLSVADETNLSFHEGDIELDVALYRRDFDQWIRPLLERLNEAVNQVLSNSSPTPDAVFLTGGTSKIPAVYDMFKKRFGADRLRSGDAFTSVAAGLGRFAAML